MKKGFTLIEVLVVMGIILVLAAVLMPVIAKAKLAADKVVAISNCGQQLVAQSMYMQDYDDHFPFCGGDSQPGWFRHHILPEYFWPQFLTAYIAPDTKGLGYQGIMRGEQLPKIFIDPAKQINFEGDPGWIEYPFSGWGYSNELSRFVARDLVNGKMPPPLGPIYFDQVYAPSHTVDLYETVDMTYSGFPGNAIGYTYWDGGINGRDLPPGAAVRADLETIYPSGVQRTDINAPFVYSSVDVVGFCDGHVKAIPAPLLIDSGYYWSTRADGQSDRPY